MAIVAAIIIALAASIFIGIGLIDYATERRKTTNRLFIAELDKVMMRSDRRRNASEMAAMIKIVEHECRRRK